MIPNGEYLVRMLNGIGNLNIYFPVTLVCASYTRYMLDPPKISNLELESLFYIYIISFYCQVPEMNMP